jgi:hypothetical protein
MDLLYIWFLRDNAYYFVMCWCLTLGKSSPTQLVGRQTTLLICSGSDRSDRFGYHHMEEQFGLPQS